MVGEFLYILSVQIEDNMPQDLASSNQFVLMTDKSIDVSVLKQPVQVVH